LSALLTFGMGDSLLLGVILFHFFIDKVIKIPEAGCFVWKKVYLA
jgi:hypothetical protein